MRAQNMALKDFEPASHNKENFDSTACSLEVTDSLHHIYPLSFHASPVEEKMYVSRLHPPLKEKKSDSLTGWNSP